MLFLLSGCFLVAPTPNPDVTCADGSKAEAGECPEDRADTSDTADTAAEDIGGDVDTADTDAPCYPLESTSGYTGCYTTRPYIEIDMELAMPVYESSVVIWDVEVEAAPEGWVGLNNLGAWLSFHDASGSGWTSDVMDNLTYTDQFGDQHHIDVFNSNPGGKSIEVGEIVSAQGDWAVGLVDAGDTVTVTFTLNIEDLNVANGDWIRLSLNSYQDWSSAETSSTSSQFGDMVGTKFLFQ